ncbi:AAA family ATPase [Streptomyces gilvifuscus]|uniref:AAA family ATPase n=1 Tax=Streptomyces gilvifuscus TaxID=1550617 RepID=A0ABT5G1C5_9ACTN|nr:AAA family ATPase [Streptomyces gilvifuscus]MDC2958501.1 AAA family ATPase [Streptomyces gilvifuscus]
MAAEYPFVGREGVLGELRAALEGAAAGRGGLVTLAGPAGAGKTRTAEEAAAHAEGFRTLWTWCPPQTVGRAFRPWSRLLRELVADDVACGRLVAASPPLRALVSGAGPGALRGADPEAARLRLTADVAELLSTAARRRPLLLVVDDAHAADASSLRLLLETADTARTMPLLLLATARDEEAAWQEGGGGPGRDRERAQLVRRGRVLALGPLPERDVATLVEAVTGAVPESEAVRSLVRRTGGEAFFVTELLRNGSWSGGAADGEGAGAFPGAVRAAVRERLADLTPRAARLLDVAAVLGTRFRLDVLAEAAEVPLPEARSLLGEAAGAGLLAEVGPHRAGFRHDLLRDAVYDALAPADRAALHHTAAEVLAGYARRGRDTGPAEVAHHLFLAGPEHATEAARHACEAAARAEALFAFEDAARWYERAVDAWTTRAEPAAPVSGDRAERAAPVSEDCAERAAPVSEDCAERAAPASDGVVERSALASGGRDEPASSVSDGRAESAVPVPGAGAESAPVPGGRAEPAAPVSGGRAEPAASVAGGRDESAVPLSGDRAERAAPVSGDGVERAVPASGDGVERAVPASGGGVERAVPAFGRRVESAGPVSGGRAEPAAPVSGGRAERSAPVSGGRAESAVPASGGRAERSAPVSGGRAESAVPGSGGRAAHVVTGSPDRAELVEMLLGLGAARLGAGEREAARGALLRAAGTARELGRPDLLARAALGLGTGPVGFEVDLDDRRQVDLLTEARAALTAESAGPSTALRAAVTARLSLAAGLVESAGRRLALAEEAVRTAREAGDPATLAAALAALCDARPGPDHCRDRLDWSARIVATARDLRDPALELLGRRLRSVALMETGAFAEADAEAAAYEAVVRPLRHPLYAWYVPLWRGTRALMEGRYEDCATELDEVERLGRRAGSANAGLLAATQRWCLYAETGDRAGLERVRAEATVLERSPMLWPRVTLALLAVQFGRPEEAARRLSAVAPRLGGAPRDSEWLPMVAQAAETVAAVGSHPAAPDLYDLLAPYAGLFVVEGIGAAVRGPVERHLALLAAAMGDPDRARTHRDAALRAAEAVGAVALVDRIAQETAQPPAVPTPAPDTALFHHEGPLWHLCYAGREARVPDSKGLHDLAVLLSRPGTPVPAVELASPGPVGDLGGDATGLHPQGDTGEAVDAVARAAYRRRLRELEEEARDADAAGDAGRSERIAVERDALVGQLAAAYGIGGRVRRTGSPAERARTAVTARIRAAVERVAAVHPELGRHLRTAVRTGTLCVYQPEQPPAWRL